MSDVKYVLHDEPAWRARSDFIFGAPIIGVELDEQTEEQLWGRQIDERIFELCCIPFFLYDLALGDIVETTDKYIFKRVLEPSNRYLFRASFVGNSRNQRTEVETALQIAGSPFESYSSNLIAVDCENRERADIVASILTKYEESGILLYETGLTEHRY